MRSWWPSRSRFASAAATTIRRRPGSRRARRRRRPRPWRRPPRAGTKIVLRDSDYGKILFNAGDQAIYLFDKETTRKPECYGDCAAAWPPVYANGEPRLGRGLDPDLLGTVKRRNGRKQITYGGHPLYYYAHEGPGQVLCQDIVEYGGTWLVVKRSGKAVPGSG